jgi:hypothetical protein
MVDLDRPLAVWVNLRPRVTNKRVTPGLATLLEDLYRRGDRQQLFLAKIELDFR